MKTPSLLQPLAPPWMRDIGRRFVHLWWLKAVGTMLFMVGFFWLYFFVMRNPSTEPTVMPRIWLDDWVGFSPYSFPLYASLWVYVSLPPAFLKNLKSLIAFGIWIALLCAFGLLIFWFFPTQVPHYDLDWAKYPGMSMIKGIDAGGNACPSLHVATAVFSACWLQRIFSEVSAPRVLNGLSWLHCIGIIWSTMASLQHVAFDVMAGLAVGLAFAAVSLSWVRLPMVRRYAVAR